jgi:hypothetical protein
VDAGVVEGEVDGGIDGGVDAESVPLVGGVPSLGGCWGVPGAVLAGAEAVFDAGLALGAGRVVLIHTAAPTPMQPSTRRVVRTARRTLLGFLGMGGSGPNG